MSQVEITTDIAHQALCPYEPSDEPPAGQIQQESFHARVSIHFHVDMASRDGSMGRHDRWWKTIEVSVGSYGGYRP